MAKQLQRIDCTVEFVTPAFLGNAFQKGQWRVPPFKALLRRWWRILRAGELNYDWERLRREEGLLWGNAFLETTDLPEEMRKGRKNGHQRSLIDIRLKNRWAKGTLNDAQWQQLHFGRQKTSEASKFAIDVDLYLGFGPVEPLDKNRKKIEKKNKELSNSPAIKHGTCANLELIIRNTDHGNICKKILALINQFGSIGGRANNGWGSLDIQIQGQRPSIVLPPSLNWQNCLARGWPHAFGHDEKGLLIWQSETFNDWKKAFREIAKIKALIRDIAKYDVSPYNNHKPTAVFLLGYPVQGPHDIAPNKPELRWASPLRFKIVRVSGGYRALAYHLPHKPPPPIWQLFANNPAKQRWIEEVQVELWLQIHETLDEEWQRWREAWP